MILLKVLDLLNDSLGTLIFDKDADGNVVRKCQLCETGSLSLKNSFRGGAFIGCSNYPECKFTSWDKPVAEACPECKNPFLIEKWKKNEDPSILCPSCGYKKTDAAA